jgi:hypothetical protein
VNSVDPVVKVLTGLDQPADPTVEFKDALLARLLAELRPAAEPRPRRDRPWRVHSLLGVRWRHGRRRRVFALAAVLLVVAVGTASAIGSVREFILDRGFIGLPPEGATHSAPESGELVLRWVGRSATAAPPPGAPLFRVWVYADGRIIWSREGRVPEGATEFVSGYLEQRLTPEGVELLRSEVIGLLEGSGIPLETVPTDDEPRGYPSLEVRDGDRLVRPDSEGTGIATPEQLAALRRVDALVTDTASVLPPSAWAVRKIRAYVPTHYAVCIETSPPKDASQLLSLLPKRAADVLRDNSRTRLEGDVEASPEGGGPVAVQGPYVTYCSKLTTEDAREVAEALSGRDPDPGHGARLAYRLAEGAHWWETTTIWFEPYFPHGQVTCSACG